jgi:chromosomal replication initiator protein
MLGDCPNPLFIASQVGIGKTHLLHAIGNSMLEKYPEAKVLYTTSEQFVSDVVDAYQHKTFDEFQKRYRSVDALLLDDVECLANRERSQEELLWVMDALVSRKSQVVISGSTHPQGLTDIQERLVSRFDSGLVVAIDPPSAETRAVILMSKARAAGITLPEEVATMVAHKVRNDVRALLGALHKIMAYSRVDQQEISVLLAYRALDLPSEIDVSPHLA